MEQYAKQWSLILFRLRIEEEEGPRRPQYEQLEIQATADTRDRWNREFWSYFPDEEPDLLLRVLSDNAISAGVHFSATVQRERPNSDQAWKNFTHYYLPEPPHDYHWEHRAGGFIPHTIWFTLWNDSFS